MKFLFIFLLVSTSSFASTKVVIDIPQTEISHPELIRLDYLLLKNPRGAIVRARANGREYHSIMPELQVDGLSIKYVEGNRSIVCARIGLFNVIRPLLDNCSFKINPERVSRGPLDPTPRDVFRIYLITR